MDHHIQGYFVLWSHASIITVKHAQNNNKGKLLHFPSCFYAVKMFSTDQVARNVMKLDSKYNLWACTSFYLFLKLCCIFISLISQSLVSTLKFQHSNKVATIPIFSTSLWLKRNPKNPPCCRVLEQHTKSLPAHFKLNSKTSVTSLFLFLLSQN